jgi:hypothetical protein
VRARVYIYICIWTSAGERTSTRMRQPQQIPTPQEVASGRTPAGGFPLLHRAAASMHHPAKGSYLHDIRCCRRTHALPTFHPLVHTQQKKSLRQRQFHELRLRGFPQQLHASTTLRWAVLVTQRDLFDWLRLLVTLSSSSLCASCCITARGHSRVHQGPTTADRGL